MKQALLRMHREEDGQVMLLALVTAVFLVLIMAFPLNVGWTISKRLRLQNAADAAAYSAAVVQADGLSAIAWLNNAMSWCYQRQYGLELKFSTYGVYATLEAWGDSIPVDKPQGNDYDLDGVAWYQDFKNRVNGKTPRNAFSEFLNGEARLINQDRNNCSNPEKRTLEMWTRMLRTVSEQIAKQLPEMMRYEAMRIAYIDTYDGTVSAGPEANQVYMAFFPDEDSDPVKLKFVPNRDINAYQGDVAKDDDSFMQYERWHNKAEGGCRFVERAMQIAADQNAFFMKKDTGTLKTGDEIGDHHIIDDDGKLNMGSIGNKDTAWFNEYDGQPVIDNGKYLNFAKTVLCWHKKDKEGHKDHDKTPCGHWHPSHTHLHFNCIHFDVTIWGVTFHFHAPLPSIGDSHDDDDGGELGYHKNFWCLLEDRDNQCSKWLYPPPGCGCLGVGDILGAVAGGASAVQTILDQCALAVQQAQQAYDADDSDENKDKLDKAKAELKNAQEKLQPVIDGAKAGAGIMGLNPLMETHVNLSVIPGSGIHVSVIKKPSPDKGDNDEAWWHHAIHYCELCFTWNDPGNSEFPASAAAADHGLAYRKSNAFVPNESQRADNHFSLTSRPDSIVEPVKGKKKSMVRAYLEDLLTDTYSSPWFSFSRAANFHQIHKSNYSPELPKPEPSQIPTNLCPTVIFKPVDDPADKHNFFNWGITVALWQRHHSMMFRKSSTKENISGIFLEMEGALAIASAKVGVRVQSRLYSGMSGRTGATEYFPERLICGIDERSRSGEPAGPYTAAYMRERFLINRDRTQPILNLFHTDWGARLIPIQKSVPVSESSVAAKYVLTQTKRIYYYQGTNSPPGVRAGERISSSNWTDIDGQGWTDEEWKFLTKLLVH
jgi:hypothetical protein